MINSIKKILLLCVLLLPFLSFLSDTVDAGAAQVANQISQQQNGTQPSGGWKERASASIASFILTSIFSPIYGGMVDLLTGILSTPDLKSISFVNKAMIYAQYIASTLLFTQFAFQVWRSMTSRAFTGQSIPLPDIIWRTFLSGVLIYAMPGILDYLLKINQAIIDVVSNLNIDFKTQLASIQFPVAGDLSFIIFFCIWVVALLGLAFSNAVRLGELVFLYILGPILAVSHAGKGESFGIWVMQAVAVSLTQSVQFLLVGAAMNFTTDIMKGSQSIGGLLLPIGSIVVAIKGPQMLKQFLYTSGVGNAITGGIKSTAHTAIYSKMMRR